MNAPTKPSAEQKAEARRSRSDAIAAYAAEMAGTSFDLDRDFGATALINDPTQN
jgi:hypothetical protein